MPTATMKALRKARPQQGAELEAIPIPKIAADEALIRVRAASICGTDLHILKGDVPSCTPGRILGHEGVGIVESVERPAPGSSRATMS